MSNDISNLLDDWEYDPEKAIRLITAEDGREVMQVRLPLGLEQYELSGRPDGGHPFGRGSMLEEVESRLEAFRTEHESEDGFTIDHDLFVLLQNEGILFYYRYLLLFQIGDYERTARDTAHNLKLCALAEKHCEEDADRKSLLQYKPYILRINALSRSMVSLSNDRKTEALDIIEDAIRQIKSFEDIDTQLFKWERHRSLDHLADTLKRLKEHKLSRRDELQSELQQAVDSEDYERAVEIRNEISMLRQKGDE